jgi:hypothetical protein
MARYVDNAYSERFFTDLSVIHLRFAYLSFLFQPFNVPLCLHGADAPRRRLPAGASGHNTSAGAVPLVKKMTFLSQFERDASIRNLVYPGKRRNRSVDVVIRNRRMPLPSIKPTWHS